MVTAPDRCVFYFCDESSQIDDQFMAVGGLAVPDSVLNRMREDLLRIKEANGNPREVKWSTTKARRDCPRRAFADYFEEAVKAGQIHFHIRFAPFSEYDHKRNPDKRSGTTSRMHFQLLAHRAVRFYGPHYKLRIYPDGGDCTKALPGQRDNLHWLAGEKYGTPHDCIEHIECTDSEKEPMLQLLDVPLGALAALRNRRVLGPAKQELADYISAKWPNVNLAGNTPPKEMKFAVWNVTPKAKPKGSPWS